MKAIYSCLFEIMKSQFVACLALASGGFYESGLLRTITEMHRICIVFASYLHSMLPLKDRLDSMKVRQDLLI